MKPRYKWQPLREVFFPPEIPEASIAEQMRLNGWTRERVIEALDEERRNCTMWRNDIYQVARRVMTFTDGGGAKLEAVHLNIRRIDGGPILRDWRHFQTIKNELVGEECEAVELYPAESRLSDTSNKFHLFAIPDPEFRFPFGDIFGDRRDVDYAGGSTRGTRQRPL